MVQFLPSAKMGKFNNPHYILSTHKVSARDLLSYLRHQCVEKSVSNLVSSYN